MKIIKRLIFLYFVLLFFLSGCSTWDPGKDPEYEQKEKFILDFVSTLFDVDYDLYEKYKYYPPWALWEGFPKPALYVDRQYFRENKKLQKFIDKNALGNITDRNIFFCIPIGMDAYEELPDSGQEEDKKQKAGKVVAIEKIEDAYINDKFYGETYEVKVIATVMLDNGRKVKVGYKLEVELTIQDKSDQRYLVKSCFINDAYWPLILDSM